MVPLKWEDVSMVGENIRIRKGVGQVTTRREIRVSYGNNMYTKKEYQR